MNMAGVVAITDDNKLVTIWDNVNTGTFYDAVAEAMAEFVKTQAIEGIFLRSEKSFGKEFNIELLDDNTTTIKWEHFHCRVDKRYLARGGVSAGLANT